MTDIAKVVADLKSYKAKADAVRPWRSGDKPTHCTHCKFCGVLFATVDYPTHMGPCGNYHEGLTANAAAMFVVLESEGNTFSHVAKFADSLRIERDELRAGIVEHIACWRDDRDRDLDLASRELELMLQEIDKRVSRKVQMTAIELAFNLHTPKPGECICWKCLNGKNYPGMVLCPTCGNKRCPKANDHDKACSGSNEPGQPGSAYEHDKPVTEPSGEVLDLLGRGRDILTGAGGFSDSDRHGVAMRYLFDAVKRLAEEVWPVTRFTKRGDGTVEQQRKAQP